MSLWYVRLLCLDLTLDLGSSYPRGVDFEMSTLQQLQDSSIDQATSEGVDSTEKQHREMTNSRAVPCIVRKEGIVTDFGSGCSNTSARILQQPQVSDTSVDLGTLMVIDPEQTELQTTVKLLAMHKLTGWDRHGLRLSSFYTQEQICSEL